MMFVGLAEMMQQVLIRLFTQLMLMLQNILTSLGA